MRAKISIAAVTVLAFVLGTMASGIYTATSRAFNPVDEKVNSPAETVKSTAQTHFVQPKTFPILGRLLLCTSPIGNGP